MNEMCGLASMCFWARFDYLIKTLDIMYTYQKMHTPGYRRELVKHIT